MYTKKVKYTNYNDEEVEGIFRFHLNKAEVIDWMLCPGGSTTLDKTLARIIENNSTSDLVSAFKDIVRRSYGEKTPDGRFEKSDEIFNRFVSTEAYAIIFMEIFSDADKTIEFLKGIMPKDFAEGLDEAMAQGANGLPEEIRNVIATKLN